MPPRKKMSVQPSIKVEGTAPLQESSSSSDIESDSSRVSRSDVNEREYHEDQVTVLNALPTDALLALSVGVCARLQAALLLVQRMPVTNGRGSGDSRIIRDEMRVLSSARKTLSAALNELLAVEAVLILSRRRAEQLLLAELLR